jgi:hypothetical protein
LISKDKDNASPQSSSIVADLGSGNPHQTPPPTTTAGQETNGGAVQAKGQDTNGGEEDDVIILGEDPYPYPNGKRGKRCTSQVWQYFDKETIEVEVDGQKYTQLWGRCMFPHCRKEYRAESGK